MYIWLYKIKGGKKVNSTKPVETIVDALRKCQNSKWLAGAALFHNAKKVAELQNGHIKLGPFN